MAQVPPRPAATRPAPPTAQRPSLTPPANVVPAVTAPADTAPAVTAPAVTAPAVNTGTAPTIAVVTTPTEALKRKGRAPRDLTIYWGVCVYDDAGNTKMLAGTNGEPDSPAKQKLAGPPVLFTGNESEAKAGILKSGQVDDGFNIEKHIALGREDFTKPSDLERHKANLATQKAAWLLDEAAAIDAGTSVKGTTSAKQLADMKTAMASLLELLKAQGVSPEALAAKLGPAANMLQ